VGRIEKCEPLPDGRFNIFLQGLYKLKIESDWTGDEAYRLVQGVPVMEEQFLIEPQVMAEKTHVLMDTLQAHLAKMGLSDLFPLLSKQGSSLDALVNFVPSVLSLPIGLKQQILEMDSVSRRYESILDMLVHGQFSEDALARINFIPDFPKIH
jgi:Lon protease-like protein